MKSKIVKIFAIVLLVLAGYHLTGIESAFCKNMGSLKASHGCEICQPNQHVAVNLEGRIVTPKLIPITFSLTDYPRFQTEEFSIDFFRPPISL